MESVNARKDLMLLECNVFAMGLSFTGNVIVVPMFQILNGIMDVVNVFKGLPTITENVYLILQVTMTLLLAVLEPTLIPNRGNV